MVTTLDKPADQAGSENLRQLPAWFEDLEVQERVAKLIAKGAMALGKALPTSS